LEGVLVNQHLGEAETLAIYRRLGDSDGYEMVDERPTPPPGQSAQRWHALADVLDDCHTVLVSGVGGNPRRVLQSRGIKVMLTEGLVQEALESVYAGSSPPPARKVYRCGEVCSGDGQGCG
jgi:nitrogen fixation protein NifB